MAHSHHDHATSPAALHAHEGRHAHAAANAANAGARHALTIALALTAGFAVAEAVSGWFSGSRALLSDAGHMVTNAAPLSLALFADLVAWQPPTTRASYGDGRAEVLAGSGSRCHRRPRDEPDRA